MDLTTLSTLQSTLLVPNATAMYWHENFTVANTTVDLMESTESRNISTTSPARAAIYVYPGPVICAFGMVCNILSLCVLSQPELSDSPYSYLTAIAVADLGMLTFSFAHLVSYDTTPSLVKSLYDAYIFFGVGNIFFNCSVWFIVLLTIERMLFVVRPLQTRSSVKRARTRIIVVIVCCCLLNIPRFLIYEVREYKHTGIYFVWGTEFRKSEIFYRTSWFHTLVINFIPLIILIVVNFVLIYTVHRARKQREEFQMNSNQEQTWRRDEARLTKTLISVVILFIVCTLPSAFVEDPIAFALFAGDKTWAEFLTSPGNQTFIYISNLLLFLNCSLNFVLYCAFNDKFRRTMGHFFGRFRLRRRIYMGSSRASHSSDSSRSYKTNTTHA